MKRQKMKKFRFIIALLALLICIFGCSPQSTDRDTIYQVSTINALLDGMYDGQITYGELKKHGDFGIGTFNCVDGEMVAVDGTFYQVKVDGVAYEASNELLTPFAVVTYFEKDIEKPVKGSLNYEQLQQYVDTLVPTDNIFYAIKIDGLFKYIKTRSIPRQEKPYPPLVKVTEKQTTFEFNDIEGTMVGFKSPSYVTGINVAGYHLHFITKDRKAGGHLLECITQSGTIEIDNTLEVLLVLPDNEEFYTMDLEKNKQQELGKVEK
jgi:acetolactate decarboxylase